jgi:hypothetical protein
MTEYRRKYEKERRIGITLKLNINTDADIISYLSGIENKQGFLKDLLRREMKTCASETA